MATGSTHGRKALDGRANGSVAPSFALLETWDMLLLPLQQLLLLLLLLLPKAALRWCFPPTRPLSHPLTPTEPTDLEKPMAGGWEADQRVCDLR